MPKREKEQVQSYKCVTPFDQLGPDSARPAATIELPQYPPEEAEDAAHVGMGKPQPTEK